MHYWSTVRDLRTEQKSIKTLRDFRQSSLGQLAGPAILIAPEKSTIGLELHGATVTVRVSRNSSNDYSWSRRCLTRRLTLCPKKIERRTSSVFTANHRLCGR